MLRRAAVQQGGLGKREDQAGRMGSWALSHWQATAGGGSKAAWLAKHLEKGRFKPKPYAQASAPKGPCKRHRGFRRPAQQG
jgi:hypothetical protein